MSKFIHPLVIERVTYDDGTKDDAGQPAADTSTSDVFGLVQPKAQTSEADDYRSAGSEVVDHVIFFPAGTDVRHADFILQGARRYAIEAVRRFEFGRLAHLEVDARLVSSTPVTAAGS